MKDHHSARLDLRCPFCMEHAIKFKDNSPPSWLTANVSTYLFKVLQIHVKGAHAHEEHLIGRYEDTSRTSEKEADVNTSHLEISGDMTEPQAIDSGSRNDDRRQPQQGKATIGHPSYNYMVKEAIMSIRKKVRPVLFHCATNVINKMSFF